MCTTFFLGMLLKGLRASMLLLFLTNSILMHCYYTFFTRPNVIFFKSLALLDCFKVIKELTFLMYLSMPKDNVTWQARVWIFNSSKPLFKTKIKNRGMLQFFLHHIESSFYFFLTFILITRV